MVSLCPGFGPAAEARHEGGESAESVLHLDSRKLLALQQTEVCTSALKSQSLIIAVNKVTSFCSASFTLVTALDASSFYKNADMPE